MKLLITGGAGFIGSNLAKYALEHDPSIEITVLDDLSTSTGEALEGLDVNFIEGSVLDVPLLEQAMEGADSVIHLGAIPSVPRSVANPVASHNANATGTLNVLEAARKNNTHVVVASSSSVYGANPKLPKQEDDYTRPMSPYAVSKLATEAYTIAYQNSYQLPTLAFRFFNVYGPGQLANHAYAAVIPKFIDAALDGRALPVEGDGTQSRDFTFVETVVATLLDAAKRKVTAPTPINLALGTNTSLLELISDLEGILDEKLELEFKDPRKGDVKASQADGTRLQELFPDVNVIPLSEGLQKTVDWFRSQES